MARDEAGPARRRRPPAHERLIGGRDVALTLALPILLSLSWLTPRGWWPMIAGVVAAPAPRLLLPTRRRAVRRLKRRFGWPESRALTVTAAMAAEQFIRLLDLLRAARPWGAATDARVEGADGPLAAMRERRGVVLWWCPFIHRDLAPKLALSAAGLPITHLSRTGHGLSATRYGQAVLNPLVLRSEMRALKARVEIDPANPLAATLRLRKEVRAGGVVAIAAAKSRHKGAAPPVRARFLGGRFDFAPGAATLAARTGAALFPVVTLREGAGFRVIVGPDISREGASVEQLVRSFAKFTAPHAEHAPAQFAGWLQL